MRKCSTRISISKIDKAIQRLVRFLLPVKRQSLELKVWQTNNSLPNQAYAQKKKRTKCQRAISRTFSAPKLLRGKSLPTGLPNTRACSPNHQLWTKDYIQSLLLKWLVFKTQESLKIKKDRTIDYLENFHISYWESHFPLMTSAAMTVAGK